MEGSNERRNLIPNDRIHENLRKHLLLFLYYSKSTISKHQFLTHLRATIIKIGIRCQVTVIFLDVWRYLVHRCELLHCCQDLF